jgi:hypothetical protein
VHFCLARTTMSLMDGSVRVEWSKDALDRKLKDARGVAYATSDQLHKVSKQREAVLLPSLTFLIRLITVSCSYDGSK